MFFGGQDLLENRECRDMSWGSGHIQKYGVLSALVCNIRWRAWLQVYWEPRIQFVEGQKAGLHPFPQRNPICYDQGGSKGGIKLDGLKDPYCRLYYVELISHLPPSLPSPFELPDMR